MDFLLLFPHFNKMIRFFLLLFLKKKFIPLLFMLFFSYNLILYF
ncbi:hypothetical protein HMPREF6123_1806 [Oribacterium sinus F0268]|uniref:Uncharacterized protein n=1 Tax=Oribacterium sinus F0268 TaxID=585501 RepID=C2KZ87_9FIRM|nr:hypothetical protein HMPREF6123_1806 [Oribacterium sinus F0268]